MKKYFLVILFFPLFSSAQSDSCVVDSNIDSIMSVNEKRILACIRSLKYIEVLGKKELSYYDSFFRKCDMQNMEHLIPARLYLAGVSYIFSEGLYIKVYIGKFRHLKNRIDQKPWKLRRLMKEVPGVIQIFYYERLICEYK